MTATTFNGALLGLECPSCSWQGEPSALSPVCPTCGKPLLARYDLARIARETGPERLEGTDLWRYRAVLPLAVGEGTVRLGEGATPLVPLTRMAATHVLDRLWLKDEAANPTQSFKARGLCLAVNGALALERQAIALPSAGNAGSAAAAYAAAAMLPCRIAVPKDTPEPFIMETRALGAEVRLVEGTIADAGKALGTWAPAGHWWNVATFKEPFRLEGKKTLGYEIAEQTGWRPPETILYPTGGGTGLVGMWRAFLEMRDMGWIGPRLPRLVAVQAAGCAPVVRALEAGAERISAWEGATTVASGLRVPWPFADELLLRAIRETNGTAIAVEEGEMLDAMRQLAEGAGCYACPEGGATLAALVKLKASGFVAAGERVVIFNTGSGLKYPEAWRMALERSPKGCRA